MAAAVSFIKNPIAAIAIPTPPIEEQEKFVQVIRQYERLTRQQREAEWQAEHLFQTLLHRAFRGELSGEEHTAADTPILMQICLAL